MNTTLREAFRIFARFANTPLDRLTAYAEEDVVGGVDTGWDTGSLWSVEGRFLYAVCRALNVRSVLEIGVHVGCSTTHLLEAMQATGGTVTSIDIHETAGRGIPHPLRERWEFIPTEAMSWCDETDRKFDLVFEDGPHSTLFTEHILWAAWDMQPKVIVGHDSEHFLVGEAVREAWESVFGKYGYTSVRIAPSDCGLAFWVRE